MTLLEKILASHSGKKNVFPGDIIDIEIDARVARDFGGANVIKHLQDAGLSVANPAKTFFTFDCNPTGSDQKYAVNQHLCRLFARDAGIRIYDIDAGIGTHILIDNGLAWPGSTAVSTDSHANILGAIGSFGQGMGDMDIAAAWHNGKVWFRVPPQVRINLTGNVQDGVSAKDIVLNLLGIFGASTFLGKAIEIGGDVADKLSLDERITISSMATEMGSIIILFPPTEEIAEYCKRRTGDDFKVEFSDPGSEYEKIIEINVSEFKPMVARPGKPHDAVPVLTVEGTKIDSAFIGSCTNGRMTDMRAAAEILKGKRVAPGVVLKIVPSTDRIWNQCLNEGLVEIFKSAGALVSNAGCAGCAAGQVGQNGAGEITISTGNRNFPGKQGKGSVYLASPETVAASAVAGCITTAGRIPASPALFEKRTSEPVHAEKEAKVKNLADRKTILEGRARVVMLDNIDTDMIFHNRYLSITDPKEMGMHTFDNLEGYTGFASGTQSGDIVVTGSNFGCGSSRQQAVDCFISLGVSAIIGRSFGSIYERNAINAALPVISSSALDETCIREGDVIRVDLFSGKVDNISKGTSFKAEPFSDVQLEIYRKGGLLNN